MLHWPQRRSKALLWHRTNLSGQSWVKQPSGEVQELWQRLPVWDDLRNGVFNGDFWHRWLRLSKHRGGMQLVLHRPWCLRRCHLYAIRCSGQYNGLKHIISAYSQQFHYRFCLRFCRHLNLLIPLTGFFLFQEEECICYFSGKRKCDNVIMAQGITFADFEKCKKYFFHPAAMSLSGGGSNPDVPPEPPVECTTDDDCNDPSKPLCDVPTNVCKAGDSLTSYNLVLHFSMASNAGHWTRKFIQWYLTAGCKKHENCADVEYCDCDEGSECPGGSVGSCLNGCRDLVDIVFSSSENSLLGKGLKEDLLVVFYYIGLRRPPHPRCSVGNSIMKFTQFLGPFGPTLTPF